MVADCQEGPRKKVLKAMDDIKVVMTPFGDVVIVGDPGDPVQVFLVNCLACWDTSHSLAHFVS